MFLTFVGHLKLTQHSCDQEEEESALMMKDSSDFTPGCSLAQMCCKEQTGLGFCLSVIVE